MVAMNVVTWACREVERQGAGPMSVGDMLMAWDYAANHVMSWDRLTEDHIQDINFLVQGGKVIGYRRTPVRFASGGHASNWQSIQRGMDMLMENKNTDTDEWIKTFLDIHPFTDGNGRTASILLNLKRRTMGTPVDLPFYYGEK